MLSQCALPFAAPGKMRGLTLQRLFRRILATQPPNVFVSSFNEHIGGRQSPVFKAATAFNMGLPNDPQARHVWVDTYGVEFSRDLEPTVEGGSRIWEVTVIIPSPTLRSLTSTVERDAKLGPHANQVAASCVTLYKEGGTCDTNATATCCTTDDKLVYANVWSLASTSALIEDGRLDLRACICPACVRVTHMFTCVSPSGASAKGERNRLLTTNAAEVSSLVKSLKWVEVCNPITGPTAFCVDTAQLDGRDGPFMLYSVPVAQPSVTPLYRCITSNATHFVSTDVRCEGHTQESRLGWLSRVRGGETLRALRKPGPNRKPLSGPYPLQLVEGRDVASRNRSRSRASFH